MGGGGTSAAHGAVSMRDTGKMITLCGQQNACYVCMVSFWEENLFGREASRAGSEDAVGGLENDARRHRCGVWGGGRCGEVRARRFGKNRGGG